MRNDELYHYGVLGMKWGVRRYQNENGSWTNRGKARRRSSEGTHHKKKLTAKQKEKLKTAAKYAAIGTAVAGGAVAGTILAKKFGPKAAAAIKAGYLKNIKGPNVDYKTAITRKSTINKRIERWTSVLQNHPKGSPEHTKALTMLKGLRRGNRKLTETSIRTGAQNKFNEILAMPTKYANYGLSAEGKAAKAKNLSETYDKAIKSVGNVAGAIGGGALAYSGAAAMDKLFDDSQDKRIARRNGQKYVRRPMNARASDYIFPNPNRKK